MKMHDGQMTVGGDDEFDDITCVQQVMKWGLVCSVKPDK